MRRVLLGLDGITRWLGYLCSAALTILWTPKFILRWMDSWMPSCCQFLLLADVFSILMIRSARKTAARRAQRQHGHAASVSSVND